jgi:hypothetical protein
MVGGGKLVAIDPDKVKSEETSPRLRVVSRTPAGAEVGGSELITIGVAAGEVGWGVEVVISA